MGVCPSDRVSDYGVCVGRSVFSGSQLPRAYFDRKRKAYFTCTRLLQQFLGLGGFPKTAGQLGAWTDLLDQSGYPFQSLEVYSRKIEKKAQEIAKDTNCRDLVLIGHSMGGIASALYAKKAAPHTVSHLITIASPWEGTPVAWLAIGANAKEIRPHSPLLASISNIQQEREDMQLFQVASSCDLLVIPGESAARKVQAERRLIIDDLGHTSLLFSKRVAQQVAIWLTNRG